MNSNKAKKLAQSFRLHSVALDLFNQGWAVCGTLWDCRSWLIEPDGKLQWLNGPKAGSVNMLRLTARPAVMVNQSGQVCGKYATDEEKRAHMTFIADQWHVSAFEGWADKPGKVREERLAVEAELRRIAA